MANSESDVSVHGGTFGATAHGIPGPAEASDPGRQVLAVDSLGDLHVVTNAGNLAATLRAGAPS